MFVLRLLTCLVSNLLCDLGSLELGLGMYQVGFEFAHTLFAFVTQGIQAGEGGINGSHQGFTCRRHFRIRSPLFEDNCGH